MLQGQKPSKNYRYRSREREGLDYWMEVDCCEKQKNGSYPSEQTVKYASVFTHPQFLLPLGGHEPLLGLLAGRLGARGTQPQINL